jgi:hypothetical protein
MKTLATHGNCLTQIISVASVSAMLCASVWAADAETPVRDFPFRS